MPWELFQDAPEEGTKPKVNQKASKWGGFLPGPRRGLCSPLLLYLRSPGTESTTKGNLESF